MLDVVQETNETSTYFTRLHKEPKSFQSKDLHGEFLKKPTSVNSYNAMKVSPARANSRRDGRTGSWNSLEVMLYESSDKKCALFTATYYTRPSNLPATGTAAQLVEYDFRLKNSITKPEEATECMEQLLKQRQTQEESADAIQVPSTFTSCKEACEKDRICRAALQEEAQPENPQHQPESAQHQPESRSFE
ncbi:uncharacterized protein [Dermacentor andersoni]|uniref:uncharacterized protein isoform X2 n=1 Tax=Dermacentor andersoni TaxID=34620 RepID=UPI002416E0E8|nr:uncharacterized protein LOC129385467 isoform X2 [Dermacentor andersoni]